MSASDLTVTIPRRVALDVLWDIDAMTGRGDPHLSASMLHLAAAIQELVGHNEYHEHTGDRMEPLD